MAVELDQQSNGSPTWVLRAACRGMDPAIFFPENDPGPAEALAVCAACPVTAECLADAYQHDDAGVRGGTTLSWRRHHARHVELTPRCANCGHQFVAPTRNYRYCSTECRRQVNAARALAYYREKVGQA